MEQLDDILIIPDVHGRTFWKDALDDIEDYDKVIFLGDYLDPYPGEGIKFVEAMEVLSSIVQLKVENLDKVVLLLGNHDLHYFNPLYRDKAMCWRYDEEYAEMAEEYFDMNKRKGIEFLAEVSRKRGGLAPVGSIVWNDLSEFESSKDFPGIYQVFGHTQQMESAVIQKSYACLDYRRAFCYQNGTFLMF